jgi:hypothetical protein
MVGAPLLRRTAVPQHRRHQNRTLFNFCSVEFVARMNRRAAPTLQPHCFPA